MARQPESVKIADPFKNYMMYQGWHCVNTHGNQYQEALPDCYALHPKYSPRWIEFKRVVDGQIHVTKAQLREWPKWIAHGAKIWVICGDDFRGVAGKSEMIRAYQKLFAEPNISLLFHSSTRKFLF